MIGGLDTAVRSALSWRREMDSGVKSWAGREMEESFVYVRCLRGIFFGLVL